MWVKGSGSGFTLAKQVGEAVRAGPGLGLVVLAKHGADPPAAARTLFAAAGADVRVA